MTCPRLAAAVALALVTGSMGSVATGNFGLSAATCSLSGVSVNPPIFDTYLTVPGNVTVVLCVDEALCTTYDDVPWSGTRLFPVCDDTARLSDSSYLHVHTFAPLCVASPECGFLPVLLMNVDAQAADRAHSISVSFVFSCDPTSGLCASPRSHPHADDHARLASGRRTQLLDLPAPRASALGPVPASAVRTRGVSVSEGTMTIAGAAGAGASIDSSCPPGYGGVGAGSDAAGPACVTLYLHVNPGTADSAFGTLMIGNWMTNGSYTQAFPTPDSLVQYALAEVQSIENSVDAFVMSLPVTGEPDVDAAVRWLLQSAVVLTKGVLNQTITMGYVELNQRDSFWTTWLHTLFFPQLDAAMLIESAQWQQPDGHIPTTVLPLILRPDNIDITEYFVLRLARYLDYSCDVETVRALYPALRKAMLYLKSRDTGEGVPSAYNFTFWADWLDIPQMQGRRFAPHYDLLWLACCDSAAQMATALGYSKDAFQYSGWFSQAYSFVNANFSYVYQPANGTWTTKGMWAGTHYQDAWFDGRAINWTYHDQTVGMFFGVVPDDRALTILQWLSAAENANEGPFGMRNLYPYANFIPNPAQYGNGGAYPWHNCIDVATRLSQWNGSQAESGLRIFRSLADTMLYRSDNVPLRTAWEYLDGDTGAAMGNYPQGWTSDCFMLPIIGAIQWERSHAPVRVRGRASAAARRDAGRQPDLGHCAPECAYELTMPQATLARAVNASRPRLEFRLPVHARTHAHAESHSHTHGRTSVLQVDLDAYGDAASGFAVNISVSAHTEASLAARGCTARASARAAAPRHACAHTLTQTATAQPCSCAAGPGELPDAVAVCTCSMPAEFPVPQCTVRVFNA